MAETEKVLKDQQKAMLNIIEDLQELKANYRELLENSRDGILVQDKDGNIVWMNNVAIEMYEVSLEAVKGKSFTQFVAPEFQKQVNEDLKEVFAGKKTSREFLIISSTGKKYWVEAAGRKTEFEGQIVNFILLKDITARKKSEEIITFKNAILEATSETSIEGILLVDDNGKVILVNKRFGEIWGIPSDVLKTTDDQKILSFLLDKLKNPADFVQKARFLYSHKDEQSKTVVELKNGQFFDQFSGPVYDNKHVYIGRIWFFHDITEIRQAEIALKSEKDKLEKYFELTAIIILIIDLNGKILLLNKQGLKILGCGSVDLIGRNWITEFVTTTKQPEPEKFLGKLDAIQSETVYFEHPISCRGESTKEIVITWGKTAIYDETGQPQAFLFAGEDITALRKAEARIVQLNEFNTLKDEFLNIAAHELKTPLTSIIGLSEIIKEQKATLPSKLVKLPDIIFSEGIRLSHIVKRILTITRFESGKEVVVIEPININSYFNSLLPSLEIIAKEKKVNIIINIKDKNLEIKGDKEKLPEVIINLFENAVKHGPENQTVTISAYCTKENMVKIEVIDQGKGIPPELVSRLFSKFSQLEPSLSRSQEGIGLGLYICKLIVEKMGGEIGVESKVGKGSKFFFTLPSNCHT